MNPEDALPQDYPLYYNGTFMRHAERGPVFVVAGDGGFVVKTRTGRQARAAAQDLSPLWARPGSYNVSTPIGERAIYLGRKGRRSARRSASTEHYQVIWSASGDRRITKTIMWEAIMNEGYPNAKKALAKLKEGESVAVSREMILHRKQKSVAVIIRGQVAGILIRGVFDPVLEGTALCKVARAQLREEGIIC